MPLPNPLSIGAMEFGKDHPLGWICGPCVIEPGTTTMDIALRLAEFRERFGVPLIFKASFDKANRTSKKSFRGPGIQEGLKVLDDVKKRTGLPVTADVHESHQCAEVATVVDLLQIPAFLARQTDLLEAAAATGRVVNVKKGQFMAPWDMGYVVEKLEQAGARGVLLTERGTTFGYGRLVNDMRSIPVMQSTGVPVVFDATHSVQLPSAGAGVTAGEREMIPYLARAAVAAGCDALFLEVHPRPEEALSDGPNALILTELPRLMECCLRIREAIRFG